MTQEMNLKSIPNRINNLNRNKVSVAVMLFYLVILICTIIMHEPWWDEAQAYLISRDASYADILFFLPHYEGHPPLWHLILSIPAKLGVPFEIGIKLVQLLTAAFTIYIFEFKSPFNNLIRIFMPFTYFFIYQYGVISRPYNLMLGALFLVAFLFSRKDSEPVKFVLALIFLCLTSLYGIAIAGGISVVWVFNCILVSKDFFKNKRRLLCFIGLLAIACLLIIEVFPAKDNIVSIGLGSNILKSLLYVLFIYPSEALFTDFAFTSNSTALIIIDVIISIVIWSLLSIYAYKKQVLAYLISSYICFSIVAMNYFREHHVGIILGLFIFSLWIGFGRSGKKVNKKVRYAFISLFVISILISMSWSLTSLLNETIYPYSYERDINNYILNNGFDKYSFGAPWLVTDKGISYQSASGTAVDINVYFKDAFIKELPNDRTYQVLRFMSEDEIDDYMNQIKNNPQVDFLFASGDEYVNNYASYRGFEEDYHPVASFMCQRIYKSRLFITGINLYARDGVIDELNLEILQ